MAIDRKDLAEKVMLYTIPHRDGLWKINAFNEHPAVQMHNIETGELVEFPMASHTNAFTEPVRKINQEDEIKPPMGFFVAPVCEPAKQEGAQSDEDGQLHSEIISDALALLSAVSECDRPKKELKQQIDSWIEQVKELGFSCDEQSGNDENAS